MFKQRKVFISLLLLAIAFFFSVSVPSYATQGNGSEYVDSFIVFADLHTNPADYKDNLIQTLMKSAKEGLKGPVSNVISAGDAFSVCLDTGNDDENLDKDFGKTGEINKSIRTALENETLPVEYVWSDHDRYADIFYSVDPDTKTEAVIEETKNSRFVYGAGADGDYGTEDDENYYVFLLSMADVAGPDDRYGAGMHDETQRKQAISDFENIAKSLDNAKPLFIVSHQPLFARRGDNIYAHDWFDKINEIAQHRDVAFFFGHNHSHDNTYDLQGVENSFPNDYFFPKSSGDDMTMNIAIPYNNDEEKKGVPEKLNFTHLCAGYMDPTTTSSEKGKLTRGGVVMGVSLYEDEIVYQTYGSYGPYEGANAVNVGVDRDNTVSGRTSYNKGEALDLTVIYQGVDISDEVVFEGYDANSLGEQIVKITYGENFKSFLKVVVGADSYFDEETGVRVEFENPIANQVTVYELGIHRNYANMYYTVSRVLNKVFAYQIDVEGDDLQEGCTVSLPVPSGIISPAVYRMNETFTDVYRIDISVADGYATFQTDSLGIFMIGEDLLGEAPEKTYVSQKTVFVPADSFEDNGKYLLVGEIGKGGERVAYLNDSGNEGAWAVSVNPSQIKAENGEIFRGYIEVDNAGAIWTATGNDLSGYTLECNGSYISSTDDVTLMGANSENSKATVIYDAENGRIKNISETEKYLYYSIHEDQMWNWHSDIISESESSRNMWIYKAVSVPTEPAINYHIDVPKTVIETPFSGSKSGQLKYTLMLGDNAVEEDLPNGKWSFDIIGDDQNLISSISEDGLVTYNSGIGTCHIKISYTWGEQEQYSVYRIVKVEPDYRYEVHCHLYVGKKVAPTETEKGYTSYECIRCWDYQFYDIIPEVDQDYPDESGENSGKTLSIQNVRFPNEGETPENAMNTPATLDCGEEHYLSALSWELLDGQKWKNLETGTTFAADSTYRITLTFSAQSKEAFDTTIADEGVYINGKPASLVSVNEEKGSITIQQNYKPIPYNVLEVREIADCVYTGKALKPIVKVAHDDKMLKAGTDYTVSYVNNTKANAVKDEVRMMKNGNGIFYSMDEGEFNAELPYAIITGKGNYSGTAYVNFNILPITISDVYAKEAEGVTLKYTEQTVESSKTFKPFTSLQFGKTTLKNNVDYTVKVTREGETENLLKNGSMPAQVGIYTLTVAAQGNYDGCIVKNIYVAEKQKMLKNATIKLAKKSVLYDYTDGYVTFNFEGASPDAVVTMKADGVTTTLREGVDFHAVYTKNDRVGTATLTINGQGEYVGSKSVDFKITGTKLTNKNTTLVYDKNAVYTGDTIEVLDYVGIKNADGTERQLYREKDYQVSYKNNVKKGTATMTVTGLSTAGYSGSIKKTFKISAQKLSENMIERFPANVTYSKSGATVDTLLKLSYAGNVLVKGMDYTLKYKGNKDMGDATVIITGKGNFAGTITLNYMVVGKPVSELNITVKPLPYNTKESYSYKLSVTVKDGNATLKKGKDYDIVQPTISKENLDKWYDGKATSPKITILAKDGSNYTGKTVVPVNIYRWKLSSKNTFVQISDAEIVYNGSMKIADCEVYYSEDTKLIETLKKEKDAENLQLLIKEKVKSKELRKLNLTTDYTVSYGKNIFAGPNKGTLKVTGIGKYSGNVSNKFTIKERELGY